MPPREMGSHRGFEQRSDVNEVLRDDWLVWHCKTSWRTLRLELGKLAITTILQDMSEKCQEPGCTSSNGKEATSVVDI